MKCNRSRLGFELVSPCPFPTTITITPRAPTKIIEANKAHCGGDKSTTTGHQPMARESDATPQLGVSSSCRSASTDIPDPLSPLLPIVHRLWQVFRATSRIHVRAGRPSFAQPYVRVHRSTLLMSSSLLLRQCPACLVRLAWIVFVMGDRWSYSWCFVRCCLQDLFNIACSILV